MKKYKAIAVITGIKLNEAKKIFKKSNPATLIKHNGKKYKMNAASGAVVALHKAGYKIMMSGYYQEHLNILASYLKDKDIFYQQVNLLDKNQVKHFASMIIDEKKKTNLDVHLVHYGGASETTVKLPGDTVFLDPWETPSEAVAPIVSNNTVTWFNILQSLKNVFQSQDKTKIILVSAITAVRTKRLHALDAIQKGAGHAMARSLALDLTPEKIYVTEIMPGITDTGFYDNKKTYEYILQASSELGYDYDENTFPVFSAERVGEAVLFALEMNAHVREVYLMPYGQYPHLGA